MFLRTKVEMVRAISSIHGVTGAVSIAELSEAMTAAPIPTIWARIKHMDEEHRNKKLISIVSARTGRARDRGKGGCVLVRLTEHGKELLRKYEGVPLLALKGSGKNKIYFDREVRFESGFHEPRR
jgi:hypothetical protein